MEVPSCRSDWMTLMVKWISGFVTVAGYIIICTSVKTGRRRCRNRGTSSPDISTRAIVS